MNPPNQPNCCIMIFNVLFKEFNYDSNCSISLFRQTFITYFEVILGVKTCATTFIWAEFLAILTFCYDTCSVRLSYCLLRR